jgi:hypothetical protein
MNYSASTGSMDQPGLNQESRMGFCRRLDSGWCIPITVGIYYLILALTRSVDADEGYFLYSARLVSEHQIPYRDFFYPQMPMVACLWGMILGLLGGVGWVKGRLLAAVLAWGCALLFRLLLKKEGAGPQISLFLFFAYLVSDFGLEWSVTVKTYLPATFFLLSGWCLVPADLSGLISGRDRVFYLRLFLSGFCVACALLSRLTVAPVILIMAVYLYRLFQLDSRPFRSEALTWLIGVILPLLVPTCMYLLATDSFWFCNWSYHLLVGENDEYNQPLTRTSMLISRIVNPLWLCMLIPVLIRWVVKRGFHAREPVYLGIIVTFVMAAFLPVRSFQQYYCMVTPWLILLAVPGWKHICPEVSVESVRSNGSRIGVRLGFFALLLAIVQIGTILERWPLGRDARGEEQVGHVRKVSRSLDRFLGEDEFFISWWPGYAVETKAHIAPGLENHFGLRVEHLMTGYRYDEGYPLLRDPDFSPLMWLAIRGGLTGKHGTQAFPAEILWSEYFIQGIIRPERAAWLDCAGESLKVNHDEVSCESLIALFQDHYIDRYMTLVLGLWTGMESGRGPGYFLDMLNRSEWKQADRIGPVIVFRRQAEAGN